MTIFKPPRLILTTDVNGTTTPHNTFAELVRPDGLYEKMDVWMRRYTSGDRPFCEVLPEMVALTARVDRDRIEAYARSMPLFSGVQSTLKRLAESRHVDARIALSTTGFGGLMALVNRYRHETRLSVAASPVLLDLLAPEEKMCLIRPIASEADKILVIRDLVAHHRPSPGLLFHVGDTMGDFAALRYTAEMGGTGVAFCPNQALLSGIGGLEADIRSRIRLVYPDPHTGPDYGLVAQIVQEKVWETTRTEI